MTSHSTIISSIEDHAPWKTLMNAKRIAIAAAVTVSCVFSSSPARAVDFFFLYDDAPGTGFLDPASGQQRRDALEYAGNIWGRLIRPASEGETINVRAKFASLSGTKLAEAKPNYYYSDFSSQNPAYQTNTNYPKALANHLNGADLNSTRHEIEITVNAQPLYPFYFGTAGTPAGNFVDFVSVAAHEIGHGLGINASVRENGDFGLFGDGTYLPSPLCVGCLPTPYDRFLTLGSFGFTLLDLGGSQRENGVISNDVFWNGSAGIQGNGGTPPRIYAPNPWKDGSSISHLDNTTFPNAMMNSAIGLGQVKQTPSAFERGILKDMGWSISVASQQASWTGAGGNNNASAAGNWSPALPLPGDELAFDSGGAAGADINMDLTLYSLGAIKFASTAPAYTLRFKPWTDTDLTGTGVDKDLVGSQTMILESRPAVFDSAPAPPPLGNAARMAFKNGAKAGNGTYELGGGSTGIHTNHPLEPSFNRTLGASLTFEGTATAETAHINVEGGSGNGGINAQVTFNGSSTADGANIWNKGGRSGPSLPIGTTQAGFGGQTRFESNAKAGTAHIRNDGTVDDRLGSGGYTTFADNSSAENAAIENFPVGSTWGSPGAGGVTEFLDFATAADAHLTNLGNLAPTSGGGRTSFFTTRVP